MGERDVIVVGAGPAGAIAAIVLARAGVRVHVLDRARFPRFKLCGDSLNPGALAILSRLGLGGVVEGALPVDGMIVTSGTGRSLSGPVWRRAQGCMISRHRLDACAPCRGTCGGRVRGRGRAGAGAGRRRRSRARGRGQRGRSRVTSSVPGWSSRPTAPARASRARSAWRGMRGGRDGGQWARTSRTWRRPAERPLRRDAPADRTLHRHRAPAWRR